MRGIGDGTLPEERFRFYVRQDYVFLIDYGRLLALGAARAPRLADMRRFAALAQGVLETEMALHAGFAERWGIGRGELEAEPPAPATAAYCDFLLRTAALGDVAELVAALLPCMWGCRRPRAGTTRTRGRRACRPGTAGAARRRLAPTRARRAAAPRAAA